MLTRFTAIQTTPTTTTGHWKPTDTGVPYARATYTYASSSDAGQMSAAATAVARRVDEVVRSSS